MLMTRHYPDLGSASDWLNQISHGTTNRKHYLDPGSVASSLWNFCGLFSDVIWGEAGGRSGYEINGAIESLAVFILEDALAVHGRFYTTYSRIIRPDEFGQTFVWLCVSSITMGTRRIMYASGRITP